MKKYLDHIHSKEPHHRRRHAMQLAGIITAAVFMVWITTLSLRLGGTQLAGDEGAQSSLSAAAAASQYNSGPNQLLVAPQTSL